MTINKRFIVFLLIVLLLSLISIYFPSIDLTGNVSKSQIIRENATLTRVIDGDTIEINNAENVRLLGINTPEKKMPFSNESKAFLEQFLNKTIELEQDKEDLDKYKRKLRYIYYNNRLINQEILELGLANTYYLDNLKYKDVFIKAESQARTLELGIWSKSSDSCSSCIILKELNATEEFFIIFNNCSYYCKLEGWFVKDAGRNTFYLESLQGNSEKTYYSKNNTNIWNDDGDRFFIFDKAGKLVLYYEYNFS